MLKKLEERNALVLDLRRSGLTLQEIGMKIGVGKERVRQILLIGERRKRYREHKAVFYALALMEKKRLPPLAAKTLCEVAFGPDR